MPDILNMQTTVSFKSVKPHWVSNILGDIESKSKSLKIITKDNNIVNIPETFKFFSPLLTNILESDTSNRETVILVPDIPTTAIVKLHELVSSGYVIDVIKLNNEDGFKDLISEIVEIAELFDIKINPTSIMSEDKEYVESNANTFQSDEIPSHLLNADCIKREVEVNDFVKVEDKFQPIDYKVEYDINDEEDVFHKDNLTITTFEASNSISTNNDDGNNNDCSFYRTSSSNDFTTSIKSIEDVKVKTRTEKSLETDRRAYLNDVNEAQKVSYSCEICSYQSKHISNLKRHVKEEHEDFRYSCESCSYQCKRRYNLKRHVQAKHKGVKFSCEKCNYQCKRKDNLKRHVMTVHTGIK